MSLKQLLELLLKSGADDDQLREGVALWDKLDHRNGQDSDPVPVPPTEKRRTLPVAHRLQSTRKASVLEIKDWMTVEQAACELGMSESDILRLIEDNRLAVQRYPKTPPLVHVRQIAYWKERHQYLEVDVTVFDRWKRMQDLAEHLHVTPVTLSREMRRGKLACYKPSVHLCLLNRDECEAHFK